LHISTTEFCRAFIPSVIKRSRRDSRSAGVEGAQPPTTERQRDQREEGASMQ
jgi:hypothetical protein